MSDKDWLYTAIDLKPGDRFELKHREGQVLTFVEADPLRDVFIARPDGWDGDPAALVRITGMLLACGWRRLLSDSSGDSTASVAFGGTGQRA